MVALHNSRQAATLAAWGLDMAGEGWWHHAACSATPDLHTADLGTRWHEPHSTQAHARHICLNHCPVLAQCAADAQRNKPSGVVQGGQVWVTAALVTGKPAAKQPPNVGCGLWCIDLPGVV